MNWKKKKQHKPRTKKFSAEKAKNPAEVEAYQINLTGILNRESVLQNDIDETWVKIKESVNEAAENLQVLGSKKNNKWFNTKCQEAIRERNLCRINMLQNATQENIQAYQNARSQASKILRQSKRLAEKKLIEDIEIYKRNPRLFFEKCKYVKQCYKARLTLMKDDQGNLITDTKKSVLLFMEFFKKILNSIQDNITPYKKIIYHTAEPEVTEPTLDEIKTVINSLKNNKSPGEDNINSELIKLAGNHLANEIYKLIYNVWTREKIPTDWNMAIICPIFKKGDPAKVENYRGISLLDTSYKTTKADLSTTNHIFTIRQIMEKYYEYNKELHMVFVDFKQAYDTINRDQLWIALANLGIPNKLIRMIKICNSNTLCKVRWQGELSPHFEVKSGLKQGDALSPFLFNLALEKVVRDVGEDRVMEINENMTMLAYADDVVVLGNSRQEVAHTVEKLIASSRNMGLLINEAKTKYMLMARHAPIMNDLVVGPYTFERVNDFKYLGVNINHKNDMHNEIKLRINSANRAYFSLNKLFTSRMLLWTTKEKMYLAYLRPIVTYACETWSTTQGDEEKLLVFERKVLRKIYGPARNELTGDYERRKNTNLESLYNKPNVKCFLKSKRMEWAGHVWRAEGSIIQKVLNNNLTGKRPRGRPRQRWRDRLNADIRMVDEAASFETASDRDKWRGLVEAAKGLKGP
ncbi:hypothetical protein QTP88_002009 [Uroleucon formosanum]